MIAQRILKIDKIVNTYVKVCKIKESKIQIFCFINIENC